MKAARGQISWRLNNFSRGECPAQLKAKTDVSNHAALSKLTNYILV